MKIKATRLVTTEAEITTPSWYKKGTCVYLVSEVAVIKVNDGMVTRWDNTTYTTSFMEYALEASTGEEITREEFEQKYSDVVASFDSVVHGQINAIVA